ncbi:SMP-30/gluconolactonase/LRE family protein [Luteimonas kalidii]|uniref:SMP-30/gluconolactonase/LRE family protein n=1 Tax=Luteimonas kalidii TaxID=3042025 RepID=A0ABT6JNY4_9GAMM|nr:SMP-30/gluconolactonase/LRE family protein [Luteimonas kalidii]MDH5832319.1 SMP-30/gluconolactonase/LRE family protein [Luteimonas kalidii]
MPTIELRPGPLRRLLLILAAIVAPAMSVPLYVATDHVVDGTFTAGIEGPATGPDGVLYAVNFAREGTIGRVTGDSGDARAELFVQLPAGRTGNGVVFDADGWMYVADYTGHAVLRIEPRTRAVAVHSHDPRMHQPNDLAIAPDGTLYASDPRWSHGDGQLWRIDRDGRAHLLETGMGTTNGIEVSPDGRHLYVNESQQRRIWAYDIDARGHVSGKRLLIAFDAHGLDGMRADEHGNLYIARYGAGTVAIVSPQGALLREVVLTGSKPTNLAFGGADGRSVFVTLQDRGAIETFRSAHRGREPGGTRSDITPTAAAAPGTP